MFVLLSTPAGKLLRAKTCCVLVRLATTSLLLIMVGFQGIAFSTIYHSQMFNLLVHLYTLRYLSG